MNTSVHFEYDPERLIEEIKKRPGIWDYNNVDYGSKAVRFQLWNEIITELIGSDANISRSDMRELELQLQKKWKSMKDCFQKYVSKHTKTARRPYVYYNQLKFLLKKNSKNLPPNSVSSESEEERNKEVCVTKRKIEIKKGRSSDDEGDETRSIDTNEAQDNDVPQKIPKTSIPPTDEFMFANVDSHSWCEDDPDKMFLLSLLPHLKAVPLQSRLNVKMDLMEVLRSASFTSVDQNFI